MILKEEPVARMTIPVYRHEPTGTASHGRTKTRDNQGAELQSQLRMIYGQAQSALRGVAVRRRLAVNAIEFPSYVCNSIGGVASTSVFDFLHARLPKVSENRFKRGVSQWKHTPYPPVSPSVRKAIFLYGDPVRATASIFRRDLAAERIW